MRKIVVCFSFCTLHFALFAQRDYTKLVNPFIGTGGHGHTYPGASMPFGMMQLSPDTRMADWDGSSGYHYSDSVIYGFSHTHLSGTGIPDYCDVLMMPFVGEVNWESKDYRSSFSHKNEKASPGYYEVLLDKHNIKVQLTTSIRSGMHQYTFPQTAVEGSVLIDLKWRDEVLESSIEKVSDHELRGMRRSKSWAQNQYLYFYVQFDKPIKEFGIWKDSAIVNTAFAEGKNMKAAVRFQTGNDKVVRARIGISAVSMHGAKLNVDQEIKEFDFDKIRTAAKKHWNEELGKINIKGGTADQQTVFYTALYHTFLSPNVFQDADGQYRGTDFKIHKSSNTTNYSVFSLWDTYRAYHPLMTIINQRRTFDWIATFLYQYKYGGMLPVWELAGNETFCMIGYHSVPVIWDAYQKGIRGFDTKLMLQAMTSYAESNRFGLDAYRKYGYIPNNEEHESVSKTLEYAYDDWCIAQFAKAIKGVDSTYIKYIVRAQNYKNVFDPQTKKMRGKVGAMWHRPFDPAEINNFYTEGNSWQYSFAVPQDISGMIELHGGEKEFMKSLNELFTTSSKTTGRDQADVTGLIGQYAHGNEPSHHMAYLFNYVGRPNRTQELVHRICNTFYKNAPDGLIGNEDCGQMSAWYIFTAMGFYPVTPGSGAYALGTPMFDEVTINLENGKTFTIKAKKKNEKSFYINSTLLNGRKHSQSFLRHEDILKGGSFAFTLSDIPGLKWGKAEKDLPKTSIDEQQIVASPYFDVETNKFKNELLVTIRNIDKAAGVQYKLSNGDRKNYTAPFKISSTHTIEAVSYKNGKYSWPVIQTFYKLPSDKTITVQSKVHPLYTGGGNETLIDGIQGTTNWRSGEWQSYFDTDFEAIIDLQKEKPVSYIGVHVLQDVSPWIVYPKEVIFYSSNDGTSFTEVGRASHSMDLKNAPPSVKELGSFIDIKTRYIKVRAINGGKLPSWHESAGNPSHLFIDEIIVNHD